jgi:hypothetical protein
MRDNREVRRWSAWLPLLAAVLLAVPAVTGTSGAQSRAADRGLAHRDAQRILRSLRLPPGAVKVVADPSSPRLLGAPPSTPLIPKLVDVHGFWRVPGNLSDVLAWVKAHAPPGSHPGMSGESASGPRSGPATISTAWVGFGFPVIPGARGYRELIVTVARARGGGTALRADAQSAPLARRSPTERIPVGVTAIQISERSVSGSTRPPFNVTDGAKVRQIVELVDALPLGPSGSIACPADMGPYVTLTFMTAGHAVATAVADGSGCGFVGLSIHGTHQPALAGGANLISRLSSLLGVRF